VLTYDVGLSEENLDEAGSVIIYRQTEFGLEAIAEVATPHPRVALAAEIDGDGRDELIVSLFFACKLAVIRYDA